MIIARCLMGVCLVASTTTFASPELKGTPDELKHYLHPDQRTVVVQGVASETAYSDLAHVTLIVTTKEKTLTEALTANADLRAGLTDEFIRNGISPDKINNAQFSSSPQYGWFGKKPSQYEVINRLKVTVSDEGQLTLLARAADRSESVILGVIEFEHSAKKEYEERVRTLALENAIGKSASYAQRLELHLVPVAFNFGDVMPRRPRSSGLMEEIIVTARKTSQSIRDVPVAMAGPAMTFDEVSYKATVEVVFEVVASE